ncbi:MAG TPA: DUF6252 family protein [Segetibacter sp.]|jgi:hypothetical protein
MKSLFFILIAFFTFSSCQKEITGEVIDTTTTTTPPATTVQGNMKAKIDGVQWIADKAAGASFSTAGNGLPRLLNITGMSKDKKLVTITLVDSGVHVYTLNDQVFQGGVFQDSASSNVFAFVTNQGPPGVNTGTVSVLSIDTTKKTISGSFKFTVYRQMDNTKKEITEGSFTNVPYVNGSNIMPPAATTDTFTVKVNNTLFKPYSISGIADPIMKSVSIFGSDSLVLKIAGLNFPTDIKPGSYILDFFGATYIGQYMDGTNTMASNSGTLELLENNTSTKRIRGKFNFKAVSFINPAISADLTEGYFSVQYQ